MTTPVKKRTGGVRSQITAEVHEKICCLIETGKTLSQACKQIDIGVQAFREYTWKSDYPYEQALRYARARDGMLESWADEIIHRAMDESRDGMNLESVARDRLRIDSMKWLLSKLKPERYGELLRIDQNIKVAKVVETPADIEDAKVEWITEHRH